MSQKLHFAIIVFFVSFFSKSSAINGIYALPKTFVLGVLDPKHPQSTFRNEHLERIFEAFDIEFQIVQSSQFVKEEFLKDIVRAVCKKNNTIRKKI